MNQADKHGNTPLAAACLRGHEGTVQLLLANGADASAPYPGMDQTVLSVMQARPDRASIALVLASHLVAAGLCGSCGLFPPTTTACVPCSQAKVEGLEQQLAEALAVGQKLGAAAELADAFKQHKKQSKRERQRLEREKQELQAKLAAMDKEATQQREKLRAKQQREKVAAMDKEEKQQVDKEAKAGKERKQAHDKLEQQRAKADKERKQACDKMEAMSKETARLQHEVAAAVTAAKLEKESRLVAERRCAAAEKAALVAVDAKEAARALAQLPPAQQVTHPKHSQPTHLV